MPELTTYDGSYRLGVTKRERFAKLVALGVPHAQAYVEAGYAPSSAKENCYNLASMPEVAARISFLKAKELDAQNKLVADEPDPDGVIGYFTHKPNLIREAAKLLERAREAGNLAAEHKAIETLCKLSGFLHEPRATAAPRTVNQTNQTVNLIDQQSIMKLIESLNDADFKEE